MLHIDDTQEAVERCLLYLIAIVLRPYRFRATLVAVNNTNGRLAECMRHHLDILQFIVVHLGKSSKDPNPLQDKGKSTTELLDGLLIFLARHQGQRYDTTDMHVRTIDMHIQFQLCAYGFDVLQALLIIGPCSANPDLNFVFDERGCKLSKCTNDTLECRCNLTSVSVN